MSNKNEIWPALRLEDWRETSVTVHLFTQIIGKIRLGLMPMEAEWVNHLASRSLPRGKAGGAGQT